MIYFDNFCYLIPINYSVFKLLHTRIFYYDIENTRLYMVTPHVLPKLNREIGALYEMISPV